MDILFIINHYDLNFPLFKFKSKIDQFDISNWLEITNLFYYWVVLIITLDPNWIQPTDLE